MADAAGEGREEKFALSTSRHFPEWLASTGGGIAFTTYQAGKLFLLGVKPDGKLSVFERTFPRCMGIAVSDDGRALALATQYQIQRFDNVLPAGQADKSGFDAVYAPHAAWVTGDVDAHDVGFDADGRPLFVNTLFGCIAAVSDGHSFRPLWKPDFISRLAAEDRCHLNGMAMEAGRPRYATAVSRSDVADGWRDKRTSGGVVIDCDTGEIVCEGLSMPHSPRLHDGRLWVLNSGAGEFGFVDLATGRFEPVAFCPGYARGLAFAGGRAVIGLSQARENRTFSGLPLDEALAARDVEPRCGLAVVDLVSGDMSGWVRIEGVVRELYDVAALPGARRPSAIGFKTDEVKHVISIED
ncbi:TIGR03032 family protein [Enterovirga sp. GCM10030262]|uniref:TIGR03032 family protein n=1 Tax=Enterovirga sp. GCM10030262 TaxID=3273391 RepID=UPI00361456FE